MQTQSK
jgi:hypothetical protein